MNIEKVFTFFFPRAVSIESANKFRSLQLSRLVKAGVIVKQEIDESQQITTVSKISGDIFDINSLGEDSSDPLLEQISQIKTDLSSLISPFSLAS